MVIADTGFWVGLFNKKDANHTKASSAMSSLTEPLVTTVPVITETTYLLLQRVNIQKAIEFLKYGQEGAFAIFELNHSHFPRITELMTAYSNLPMDLADASLVVLAEHLGHGRILSTDKRDFHSYRWKNRHPFENLLHL